MAVIDPSSIALYDHGESAYASLLRRTATEVLDSQVEPINAFLTDLANVPSEVRLFLLHDDPLDVASELTGRPINESVRSRYAEFSSNFVFPDYTGQTAQQPEAPPAKRRVPYVPLAELDRYLMLLGYNEHVATEGSVRWTLRVPRPLPSSLVLVAPTYRTRKRVPSYRLKAVAAVYTALADNARSEGSDPELLELVHRQRDELLERFR